MNDENGFAYFVRRKWRKPIIATVQGGAFAGGFEIMLACDLAIASAGARFALPEVKRGIIAAGGGAMRLPLRVPLVVAREMLLTGNPITAERSFELGLLSAVVASDELERAAEALASTIADNAPIAIAASLALCDVMAGTGEQEGWAETARQWRTVETSDDAREGAVAFTEKRKPVWRGAEAGIVLRARWNWTAEGWLYVGAVVDLFSRRVVGWAMKAEMTAQFVVDALNGDLVPRQARQSAAPQ